MIAHLQTDVLGVWLSSVPKASARETDGVTLSRELRDKEPGYIFWNTEVREPGVLRSKGRRTGEEHGPAQER